MASRVSVRPHPEGFFLFSCLTQGEAQPIYCAIDAGKALKIGKALSGKSPTLKTLDYLP